MRMTTLCHLLSSEIASHSTGNIADLCKCLSSSSLYFVCIHSGGSSTRGRTRGLLKFRVFCRNLLLGIRVQLRQAANLEFVQLDSIGVRAEVKGDGNQLD